MKKIKLTTIALLVFAGAAFTSCSNDDDSAPAPVVKEALVTKVEGATTGHINQEVALNVSFTVDNSCGAFSKFVETTPVAKTTEIKVEATYAAGSNCGTTAATKVAAYKFKAATVGTYILKFKKSATESITQTIVID